MKTPNINQILRANSVSSARGAPMGAANYLDDPEQRLYVQRIEFVDGDYAPDGTYWGGGSRSGPLWCAFSADGANRIYVRATTRGQAVAAVLADWPAEIHQPGIARVYDFYEDPGHGWAKVRRVLVERLGIDSQISDCSYQRGDFVYLEEDGDLGLLFAALKALGITPQLRRHVGDRASRIRNYSRFTTTTPRA